MLVVAGFVVFGLGAAIFLTTGRVLFWSGGIANRVWIAAALGVALVAVGGAGWATSRLSNGWRRWAFSTSIAALCTAGFLINTALATYWIDAWPRQVQVIERIRRVLPQPQPGVTLILHGVCPYVGPAIVFESSWDLAGALRVVYRDPTLRADVTTGRFSVGDDGLETRIYTDAQFYPYDDDLLLYNDRTGTVVHVTDGNIARAHLTEHTVCAEGRPGRGTLVLPLDEWYEHLLSNDLLPPWR
jgi:hypothetical protein